MFGLHPFAAQSFGSAIPFVDALTTTNALSLAQSSVTPLATIVTTSAGIISSAIQTLPSNSLVLKALPTTNSLTFSIQTPSTFTYNDVSDSVGETWSDVVTTTNTESWSDT